MGCISWGGQRRALAALPVRLCALATLIFTASLSAQDTPGVDTGEQPGAAVSGDSEPRVALSENLDWVPIELLTIEQRSLVRSSCCGAYIEPPRHYRDADLEPEKADLRVSADSSRAQGNRAVLEGDVQVTQGYRQVRSDKATLDRDDRTVELEGNITYREPGILITGDHAFVDMDSDDMHASGVSFVLHEPNIRGQAEALSRPEEDRIYVDDVTYTTCEPGSDHWQLSSSSLDINTTSEQATARNVVLRVRDVPVAYVPWIRFPITDNRATGLLFPSILAGNDNGFDYAQPVYINLAPNYDATLTPRLIQERGAMAEAEFRYLARTGESQVSGGYLWDDQGDSSNDRTYRGEDRWTLGVDHVGGWGRSWSTMVDYTDVSDIDYFRDIDSASLALSSANHLNQEARVGYATTNWDLRAKVQAFETLILDGLQQYKQLPRLDARGDYRFDSTDLVLSLKHSYVMFDHREDDIIGTGTPWTRDDKNTTITGSRLRMDYRVTWDKEWLWGFFRPAFAAKYIGYDLNDPLLNHSETRPQVLSPVTSLDTGLFFERNSNLMSGYIQTFEPRLYYLNSEYRDQSDMPNFDTSQLTFSYHQLFRDDRFSGNDRIGDTEQLTVGATSRIIDARSGQERIRLSLGQVVYLSDRRIALSNQGVQELTRDSSDIAVELSGRFANLWRIQSDLLTTDDGGTINKAAFTLRYNNETDTAFNLGYRYSRRDNVLSGGRFVRADLDQAEISLAVPINENWRLLGRYYHDLRVNQELEVFAGVEYSSCCWRLSVVARRWIERDDTYFIGAEDLEHNNGIFFQFQLRGLAGTGQRVSNILSEGIYGYQPPED
ncbi:MAG: LPS-assembly protein LptD [Porticoccaceae bacterium]